MRLKISNFSKEYRNKTVTINDIELRKRVTFIVGENGCGKSTLLKAIAGLISYKGEIDSKLSICYLAENPSYPSSITVYEFLINLSLIDRISETIIDDFLDIFKLKEKRNIQISNLSKGMLQKLNLIQCLMQNKDLYLLDEPFSGLDQESVRILNDYIKESRSQYLISSHLLNLSNFKDMEVITLV